MSPLEKHSHIVLSARSWRIRSRQSVGSVLRKSRGGRAGRCMAGRCMARRMAASWCLTLAEVVGQGAASGSRAPVASSMADCSKPQGAPHGGWAGDA